MNWITAINNCPRIKSTNYPLYPQHNCSYLNSNGAGIKAGQPASSRYTIYMHTISITGLIPISTTKCYMKKHTTSTYTCTHTNNGRQQRKYVYIQHVVANSHTTRNAHSWKTHTLTNIWDPRGVFFRSVAHWSGCRFTQCRLNCEQCNVCVWI